jgi:type IV secretory pathway TrbL component
VNNVTLNRAVALGALMGIGLLAGCSHSGEGKTDLAQEFDATVSQAIKEAMSGGASTQQLDILERAAKDGGVTFEDAKIAATTAMSCMADQGVTATYQETALPNGVTIPAYVVNSEKSDGTDATGVMDQCEQAESFWVNKLYQTQPTSVEANFAFIEKQAPVIRKCLEDAGYDTDPKATGMDLVIQAGHIADQTSGATNCASDAGVVNY